MPLQLSFGLDCVANVAPLKDYLEFVAAGEDQTQLLVRFKNCEKYDADAPA